MLHTMAGLGQSNRKIPLYKEFRRFMLDSHKLWKKRYPKFRSNYQGDKLIGYSLVKDWVTIPKQYYLLNDISELTPQMIYDLGDKPFVIKATLGHQGNRVLCFESWIESAKRYYCDKLRSKKQHLNINELIIYAVRKLSRKKIAAEKSNKSTDFQIIIEEYLGCAKSNSNAHKLSDIPIDYKVYTVFGKAKVINLYIRGPDIKYMACFDRNWDRIPLNKFYVKPNELGYEDYPGKIPLPPSEKRKELIKIAERLATVHKAMFCRYDFYYETDRIYFGEITPVCGGIKNHDLTEHVLDIFWS